MGWTSDFPEITETSSADAFEMTRSALLQYELMNSPESWACRSNDLHAWRRSCIFLGNCRMAANKHLTALCRDNTTSTESESYNNVTIKVIYILHKGM